MANSNISKYFTMVMTNSELAEKLVSLANENGYMFAVEELLEWGASRPLFDNETDQVQGGTLSPYDRSYLPGIKYRKPH